MSCMLCGGPQWHTIRVGRCDGPGGPRNVEVPGMVGCIIECIASKGKWSFALNPPMGFRNNGLGIWVTRTGAETSTTSATASTLFGESLGDFFSGFLDATGVTTFGFFFNLSGFNGAPVIFTNRLRTGDFGKPACVVPAGNCKSASTNLCMSASACIREVFSIYAFTVYIQ
jgi:hypothetical protein